MKISNVKKLLAVIILATAGIGSSLSMDKITPPTSQDELNTRVARTAERFLLSRPEVGWELVPVSDFNMMKITPCELWELKQTPVRVNNGYIQYPTLVYKGTFKGDNFSRAVKLLTSQPAVLDCTLGTTFCQLIIQMDLLGEYFDTFAKEAYDNGRAGERFVYILSMSRLIRRIEAQANPPIGCWFGLNNIPAYKLVHPNGIAASENLFCVGEGRFVGFGAHFDDPKTREEIFEDLYASFMKDSATPEGKRQQEDITKERFMEVIHQQNQTVNVGVVNFEAYKQTIRDLKRTKRIADKRAQKKK